MRRSAAAILILLIPISGCNRPDVVPDRLEEQVDKDLRYSDVKENPSLYKGKTMLAGGKVLSAKRVEEGTRVEVLHIPLSGDLVPEAEQSTSQGRFIAVDVDNRHIIDPAVLDDQRLITVVGEVQGVTTITVDEVDMQVPRLIVKHVTVWDRDLAGNAYRPYEGYYAPYAWGYGPRYGFPLYW